MDKQPKNPSPRLVDRLFLWAYWRSLRRAAAGLVADPRPLLADVAARRDAYLAGDRHRLVDRASASHLWMTSTVAATYEALRARPALRERALEVTRALFLGTGQRSTRRGMALFALLPDPFRAMVSISKGKERGYYGATFERRVEQDDASAYRMSIHRCFYHQFFVDHGVPELGPVFCEKDHDWGDAIDPGRLGLRFDRPTTLATGGDRCRFEFRRVRLPIVDARATAPDGG
ncbi:MAG: L-2-amino-thiazoline-4-carboxylic acid hydrolase [Nannocystaceae bacterium]